MAPSSTPFLHAFSVAVDGLAVVPPPLVTTLSCFSSLSLRSAHHHRPFLLKSPNPSSFFSCSSSNPLDVPSTVITNPSFFDVNRHHGNSIMMSRWCPPPMPVLLLLTRSPSDLRPRTGMSLCFRHGELRKWRAPLSPLPRLGGILKGFTTLIMGHSWQQKRQGSSSSNPGATADSSHCRFISKGFLLIMKSLNCNWNLRKISLSCGKLNWKSVRHIMKVKEKSWQKKLRRLCMFLILIHMPLLILEILAESGMKSLLCCKINFISIFGVNKSHKV